MTTLPVPLFLIQAAAGRVLRAGPGRRGKQLQREGKAFRAILQCRHCPPRVAEAFTVSFSRAVMAQVEAAPGGMLQ